MEYTLAKLQKSKASNDWYAYYRYRNADGKMIQFKERAGINRIKNLKEREREGLFLVASINGRLKGGWSPFVVTQEEKEQQGSVLELLKEYLATKETSIRKRSYEHYVYAINLLTQYLTSIKMINVRTKDFTKQMAFGYSDWLLSEKKYSGKSHNNQIANMRTFFQMMEDRDVITKNPFRQIKKKKEVVGRIESYSDAQRKIIKDYMIKNNHPMYLFVQLIYYCFVRPNEIMQTQVKYIDWELKRIQIPSHISKNGKQCSIDIPSPLFKLMNDKYKKLDPELYLFSKGLVAGEKPILRKFASERHKKMLDDLKIKGLVLYDWKHAGARDFILSGRNPYELMVSMRHSDLEQSMTYLRSLGVSFNDKSKIRKHEF